MTNNESTPLSSLRVYLDRCANDTLGCAEDSLDGRKDSHRDIVPIDSGDRRQRELDRLAGVAQPKTVALTVGQIVPLLIDAMEKDRAWLRDFAQDTIRIDADLYDVLLAYQRILDHRAA